MYDDLGMDYDIMVQWKRRLEKETPFFQRLFSEKRITRVLDLGCGSGHHARLFHNWGCEVVGVDPSPTLLEIARGKHTPILAEFERNTQNNEPSLKFIEANFLNFPQFVQGHFDGIFCLGNTLPHLKNTDELEQALSNIFEVLKPGGVFVFQNRNYDRLLETKERFQFPTTQRSADNQQIFFRFNDFEGDKIRFNIVHFTQVGERWIHKVYTTELYPWRFDELKRSLLQSGFSALDFYSDFSGAPFDTLSSADLVGLARRGE